MVKYIHIKYAKICIGENKSLQKLVSLKSLSGVKYVMLGHIFVIQKFSSFVKLLEHSVELFLTVSHWNNNSKVFLLPWKKCCHSSFFYILKVHLTYLTEPSRVVAKNEIFDRYFFNDFAKVLLQHVSWTILKDFFWNPCIT